MYTLKISNSAFIEKWSDSQIVITSNCDNAFRFERIGDAMKVASELNKQLNNNIISIN